MRRDGSQRRSERTVRPCGNRASSSRAIGIGQLDGAARARSIRGSPPESAGNRHDQRREIASQARAISQGVAPCRAAMREAPRRQSSACDVRPAQRPVGQDAMSFARQCCTTPPARPSRPDAQRDLNRVDRDDAAGLLDLADGDVGEADPIDQSVALERGQRPNARRKRHARIGRVQLIDVESLDAKGTATRAARLARCLPRPSAAHALPAAQAAFRRDHDARSIAIPRGERCGDQPLVMAGLRVVAAVGVGGVEQRDAGGERCVQRGDRAHLVAVGRGREPHAPSRARGASERPHQWSLSCDWPSPCEARAL